MTTEITRLSGLAAELREAAGAAVERRSWFAPTLDDCRVDIERLSSVGDAGTLDPSTVRMLVLRAELVLRTWRQVLETIKSGKSRWHCPCGGTLVDVARPGRVVPFRGREVELPAGFIIPTCDRCASERLDDETATNLDTLLLSSFMSAAADGG
jgi:hypothetical protein